MLPIACVASSMSTWVNLNFLNTAAPLASHVAHTTSILLITSLMSFLSFFCPSLLFCFRYSSKLNCLNATPTLSSQLLHQLFEECQSVPELAIRNTERPSDIIFSMRLSTAMFVWAAARISPTSHPCFLFFFAITHCLINSAEVLVFPVRMSSDNQNWINWIPVPGGPWINVTRCENAARIAFFWLSFTWRSPQHSGGVTTVSAMALTDCLTCGCWRESLWRIALVTGYKALHFSPFQDQLSTTYRAMH